MALNADRLVGDFAVVGSLDLDHATAAHQIQIEFKEPKRKRERCLGAARSSGEAYQCLIGYPVI